MKYFILAAVLIAAACATGTTPSSQAAAPGGQGSSASSSSPNYQDARSSASDEEVRVARRAYRGACERRNSTGYCECMTGGMAQALSPSELAIATAAFTGANVSASAETRAHVESVRAQVDHGCATFH
ncbi:MAG: hypothetical protein JSS00_14785 [Proteobacteria bacterium]|nr:hypothetical protein [Pseudomonadota bacterium]